MMGRGSRVSVRGEVGTVLDVKNGFAKVSVGSRASWEPIEDMTDVSDEPLRRLMEGDVDDPLGFILAMDANRLLTKYKFDPYVLASSTKITIYPHQIDEVIWGIDNRNIMIADEVGLGKTIIAALIASELRARGLADRVLYVVPKSLVLKWQDELRTKFDTRAEILDSDYVRVRGDPFSNDRYDYVASVDFLKQENRRRLLRNTIDLAVVDEAHKLKPDNERYELGVELGKCAKRMIFLTATPHDGKPENFLGRMRLLDPFVTDMASASHLWKRNVKENVVDMDGRQVFPERASTTVNTELTNKERDVHRMLDEYVQDQIWAVRNPQDRGAVRFLATILKKRAASSLRSLRSTLERRMERMETAGVRDATDPDDMENDGDYEDRAHMYEHVRTGGDAGMEMGHMSNIMAAIDGMGDTDSKFDKLVEFIGEIKGGDAAAKILLFTEYRDTADYLGGRLAGRYKTGRIDGTMDRLSRKTALEEFSRENGPDILLCTDAAAEGVDMQFCNVEFNYDMPWNPNRLEQRMGRIHRIGQTRKVRYYNFVVDRENTIDGMIHGMLLDKIDQIKADMGDDSVFDILGRIIGEDMIGRIYGELRGLPREAWKPKITAALEEIERTREDVRQKTDRLLTGKSLDRTVLRDIREKNTRSVDATDVRRFLETWTESNGGRYDERDNRVRILVPGRVAPKTGGTLDGTLDGDAARERNLEYLALGNRRVQIILEDAARNGSAASLRHERKSGLLCVCNRSVVDGDGQTRNSETVMAFCNEDGTADMVDVDSVWDYEEAGAREGGGPPNSDLLARMKGLAERRICEDGEKFHRAEREKLDGMRRMAKDAVDLSVGAEVERQNEKIGVWESRKHSNPSYGRLISDARGKIRRKMREGGNLKRELDRRFESHLRIDLIGLATVTPEADANARTMSERAGMDVVLEMERNRAGTEGERMQVRDVSGRDTGYDIETWDRSIEVKSFGGHPNPGMTSHEWTTAGKLGGRYWLYVVENVHTDARVTKIRDPQKTLAGLITREPRTSYTYSFSWAAWKSMSGSNGESVT